MESKIKHMDRRFVILSIQKIQKFRTQELKKEYSNIRKLPVSERERFRLTIRGRTREVNVFGNKLKKFFQNTQDFKK